MKPAKTMGELRSQLTEILAKAVDGKMDEKNGRLAINAATRVIESFQAECRSRLIAVQLKETAHTMGSTPLD